MNGKRNGTANGHGNGRENGNANGRENGTGNGIANAHGKGNGNGDANGIANGHGNGDARLERWLGLALTAGVAISTLLLGAGLVLALAGLVPATSDLLLRLGLITLMATPVARVVISVLEYGATRDWVFLALTGAVLTMLLMSLTIS